MKKVIALVLCILSISSLAACGSNNAKQDDGDNVQIPNPIADYATMDEAAAVTGFDMTVPESIDGYSERSIAVIANEMLQVSYTSGDNKVLIRKAAGTEDISGDYTAYAETNEVAVDDVTVTMKGNDGTVNVATWTSGEYVYAISISGVGMSAEAVAALVQSIG